MNGVAWWLQGAFDVAVILLIVLHSHRINWRRRW